MPAPSCRWPSGPRCSPSAEQELAEPHLRGAERAVEQVPPERRAQFAAASAAVGLYEGRFGGDPSGCPRGRAGLARARPRARGPRGGAQPAWPAPHPAGDRRDVDRRPRCGGRAPRACPRGGRRGRRRVDRVRLERAPRAGQPAARRPRALPAPRPPGAGHRPSAVAGRDRSPPAAAVLRARRRLHPARSARRGRTPHRPGERGGARHTRAAAAWPSTPSIACSC